MMVSEAKIYATFGLGAVSTGCFEVKSEGLWCISIKELKACGIVGEVLPKGTEHVGSTEILLAFPTESQMLNTMAALTNQDVDVVIEYWNAKKLEREAL